MLDAEIPGGGLLCRCVVPAPVPRRRPRARLRLRLPRRSGDEADPTKYQALRDEVGRLPWVVWVFAMPGLLDPLESYYKWNLDEGAMFHALRLETDPARSAALGRAHAIDRRAIGHHENAYFQTIDAALDPALARAGGAMSR